VRLLHEVHWPPPLFKEMFVHKVEKLLIVLIWNEILAGGLSHAGDGGWSSISIR
jgi:hypothetical protein